MPKVSVIMNCYNGEEYLREAIDSVYAQTFDDWEIIFWDNASTDQTPVIAASYGERLRYFRSSTMLTLGAARRQAVEQAAGEWVAFLDCDDYWYPEKLETQISALAGTDHVLCYAGIREIEPDGTIIREVIPHHFSGNALEQLLQQFDVNMVTPMLRLAVLKRFGLNFDENITASEEYNLFVRLAAKGSVLSLPNILGVWRISPGSLTDRQIAKWSIERYYTLDQLKRENPGIDRLYPAAFREAYARGDYYKVRYLMSEGRVAEARKVMAGIAAVNFRYRLLLFGLYVPSFWGIIHGNFLKRRVLPRIFGYTSVNSGRVK